MANDPLAEVVTLLRPAARFSKLVEGAGSWRVDRQGTGEPFYCAVLQGSCRMIVDGQPAMTLEAGDYVLVPALHNLVVQSLKPPPAGVSAPPRQISKCHFRIGLEDAPAEFRAQLGHCSFGSPDAELLVSLLPQIVLARREPRLAMLIQLIGEETLGQRPARDLVLERLLEVMLIEALRSGSDAAAAPGLARGLSDERLATAIRVVHARPEYPWTIEKLATEAALSRSAFFARFHRTVGIPPMEYLLTWRMALAKRLLRGNDLAIEEVAGNVGYSSASTFTVAFVRHVGMPPARYARAQREERDRAAKIDEDVLTQS
jgi:AraC-like DNA-binding protein